jgi:hypothetical protein
MCALFLGALALGPAAQPAPENRPQAEVTDAVDLKAMKAGDSFKVGGRQAVVREVDITPVVRNEYYAVHTFDTYENPKLTELREKYRLMEVIAPGKDEFDKQVLLMDWVYRQFKHFGSPTSDARGALDVLKAVEEGHTFFCAHYGDVMVGTAASVGWIDRPLALRTYKPTDGSTEHTITEIWSDQYRKWVMFDPTYALYVEKDGQPLNAYEIRQEWLCAEGKDLTFVIGAERKRYTKADMPIFRAEHPGFGTLALGPASMDKYAFLGYIPNNNLMDGGPDYARMFITKDAFCEGIRWHTRKNPADPAHEPYFPLNQADLNVRPAPGTALEVKLDTCTPNFAGYRHRLDGGDWKEGEPGQWQLHDGPNSLEVMSVNKFGVEGTPSKVVLEAR